MAAGLLTVAVLVALPFVPADENTLTGAVLFGFAVGWALLAVLSVRFSDQPQSWAAPPAAFMAVLGVASLSGSAPVHAVLGWVWPPVLLVTRGLDVPPRRGAAQPGRPVAVYPVLVVLGIA